MVKRLQQVLFNVRPDLVVVYDNTNSTLAGDVITVEAGFKVTHVEVELRGYDIFMPEEINRKVFDYVFHLLFAFTKSAVGNPRRENVPGKVYLTGDVHANVLKR